MSVVAGSLCDHVVDGSPHVSALAHSKSDELQRMVLMFCSFSKSFVRNGRFREL